MSNLERIGKNMAIQTDPLVIGAYVLLFMLVLPITVGTWWYKTMRFSNNNVLLDTIRYFCVTFMRSPYMAMPRVIKVLSNAYEFNPAFNKEIVCRPSDNIELPPQVYFLSLCWNGTPKSYLVGGQQIERVSPRGPTDTRGSVVYLDLIKKAIVGSPSSVKARALIYAHLERIDLPAKTLYWDKQYIIKNSPRLIDEMINSLLYVLAVATDEGVFRLLFTRNIKSIRQLVRLPDEKRRALLRSLSDEQYRDLLNVCASMPMLSISYQCEVLDDDDPSIWPLSMVTATVLLRRTPLFEPSAVNNATTFQDSHYNGSGPNARPDSSAYDHLPNSQLYPAATGSGTVGGSADAGFDGASPMGYADLGDDYPDMLDKPKKSATPVWDKGKRKKPARKKKQQQQQQQQQQQRKQQQLQQARTANTSEQQTNNDLDSDAEEIELVGSKGSTFLSEASEHQTAEDGPTDACETNPIEMLEGDEDVGPENLDDPTANTVDALCNLTGTTSNEPLSEEKLAKNRVDKSGGSSSGSSNRTLHSIPHFMFCFIVLIYAKEKFEGWWVYLVDRRTRQLVTKPVYVATLQTEEEIPLRFVAPSVPGSYMYTLCVRSDSYMDSDFSEIIRFTVSPLPERVVRYLKEQEEAHSDSSAASSDSGEEDGLTEDELSEIEDGVVQPANQIISTNTDAFSQEFPEEEEEDDYDDERNGRLRPVDDQRLSAYLAKL
ncbi:unnamed protein product [Echinostoma caproni]|uniref:SEC63 domain-containing protein n=1 Tax=Echinostoma caproni TaxID=27848 RepID=A0A183AIG7_9TREM|nr:unnamed protein product [Echinostoma caproni]